MCCQILYTSIPTVGTVTGLQCKIQPQDSFNAVSVIIHRSLAVPAAAGGEAGALVCAISENINVNHRKHPAHLLQTVDINSTSPYNSFFLSPNRVCTSFLLFRVLTVSRKAHLSTASQCRLLKEEARKLSTIRFSKTI